MRKLSNDVAGLIGDISSIDRELEECFKTILLHIPMEYSTDIEGYYGGPFYLVEAALDLKDIYTNTSKSDGSWYTLYDYAASFDYQQVLEKIVVLANIVNNSGGPTYIIPRTYVEPTMVGDIQYVSKVE